MYCCRETTQGYNNFGGINGDAVLDDEGRDKDGCLGNENLVTYSSHEGHEGMRTIPSALDDLCASGFGEPGP